MVAAMSSRSARCFNPHPHAAGDVTNRGGKVVFIVSIHTRTRRVTILNQDIAGEFYVSIHTRTRRVTPDSIQRRR